MAFPISYRDLADMLSDRGDGVTVDRTTVFRWVQAYAATLEQRVRRHLRPSTGSWRVDETHVKVKGVWTYLCRAVDSLGQSIGCGSLRTARRTLAGCAAMAMIRKGQVHNIDGRHIQGQTGFVAGLSQMPA